MIGPEEAAAPEEAPEVEEVEERRPEGRGHVPGFLSGRAASRAAARAQRLKGPGYTRAWRKGRTKRQRPSEHSEEQYEEVQDARAHDQG